MPLALVDGFDLANALLVRLFGVERG